METVNSTSPNTENTAKTKFCKHCGGKILESAVICPLCGCQVEEMRHAEQPNIVINNSNANVNSNVNANIAAGAFGIRAKNKWVSLILCIFLGYFGAHKFYEEKIGMGILYLFTMGLFGIGWFIDCISLLFKPNPYYVR